MYVRYYPKKHEISGIKSWYCTCLAGIRSVGCCVHIMSVIFYFSYGRYLDVLPNPASNLRSVIIDCNSSSEDEFDLLDRCVSEEKSSKNGLDESKQSKAASNKQTGDVNYATEPRPNDESKNLNNSQR